METLHKDDVCLIDDGTLDTVLSLNGRIIRFNDMNEYRDIDGILSLDRLLDDYWPEILEEYHLTDHVQ